MKLPVRMVAQLHVLAAHTDGPLDLPLELAALLALAVRAVPSCLTVTLEVERGALTVAALTPAVGGEPVRASLAVFVPTAGQGAHLVLYACVSRAFDALAVDLRALLDLDPGRVVVDRHLGGTAPPDSADRLRDQLADRSAVDRALGVLVDRGFPLVPGRAELSRLAALAGGSIPEAARGLLAGGPS